jgi:hypothetical protein
MFGPTCTDNSRRQLGRLAGIAWLAVMLLGMRQAGAGDPPLWGRLTLGPHAVGFRSTWELDPSRAYAMTFEDKTP